MSNDVQQLFFDCLTHGMFDIGERLTRLYHHAGNYPQPHYFCSVFYRASYIDMDIMTRYLEVLMDQLPEKLSPHVEQQCLFDSILKTLFEITKNLNHFKLSPHPNEPNDPLHPLYLKAIQKGADPNIQLYTETLLFQPIPPDTFKTLLELGLNPHAQNKSGLSGLMKQMLLGKKENALTLLSMGESLSHVTQEHRNILHFAELPFSMVTLAIEHGANVNQPDNMGQTPLFYHMQSPKIQALLIEHGADPFWRDAKDELPLGDYTEEYQKIVLQQQHLEQSLSRPQDTTPSSKLRL